MYAKDYCLLFCQPGYLPKACSFPSLYHDKFGFFKMQYLRLEYHI